VNERDLIRAFFILLVLLEIACIMYVCRPLDKRADEIIEAIEKLEPPGAGTSFKMIGTVPPKNEYNFGGFYNGFPSNSENISSNDNW